MGRIRRPWNGLGNSEVFDTHQYAQRAAERPGKNKYKCVHYDPETGLCEMNNIGCVGPSNSLCPDYCTDPSKAKQPPNRNSYHSRKLKAAPASRPKMPGTPSVPKPVVQPKPRQQPKPRSKPTVVSVLKPNLPSVSVGMMVKHVNAGKGKVVKIDLARKAITIRINGIDSAFPFPESFDKGYLMLLPQDNGKK